MKHTFPHLCSFSLCLVLSSGLFAESSVRELSRSYQKKAVAALKSHDEVRRASIYRTLRKAGDEAVPGFRKLLTHAEGYHLSRIKSLLKEGGNPYVEISRLVETLKQERARVMEKIHTDWKKSPSKIRDLSQDLLRVEKLYKQLEKRAGSGRLAQDARVSSAYDALLEIRGELSRLDDEESGLMRGGIEDVLLKENESLRRWKEQRAALGPALAAYRELKSAGQHNADCAWAKKNQRNFSNLLNYWRSVMGLAPLRLEERLSEASWGHSNDMRTQGFFSHTSPVKGKESPAQRARKAGFKGRWMGENIYMGSPDHQAAFDAWFGSDGHRFIMFTRGGENMIGVGVDGRHWTMVTGKK